jgi:hypothetical protein
MFFLKSFEESPARLLNLIDASYSKVRILCLLKAAVHLDLFDCLENFKSAQELSSLLEINLTLTEYLLKVFRELDLLEDKSEDNIHYYKNKEITNIYLRKNSECNIIHSLQYYFDDVKNWENLESILKNQQSFHSDIHAFFPDVINRMANECKYWELPKVLREISQYKEFKNARKLLDLAGGHGLYAIGFGLLNKDLKSYVFDLPHVVEQADKFIRRYKAKNVFTIAGDFYKDDIGTNYDVIFTSYNPGGKNPQVAKKVYAALREGGLFIDKQFFLEEGNSLDDYLSDMEWHFSRPEGLRKGVVRFTFKGDLNFDHYLEHLEELGFKILDTVNMQRLLGFGCPSAKMIISRK